VSGEDRPWWLDEERSLEQVADSLIAELEAINQLEADSVWVRRGETGPWTEITAAERRERRSRIR
jgi:hypothetical protein